MQTAMFIRTLDNTKKMFLDMEQHQSIVTSNVVVMSRINAYNMTSELMERKTNFNLMGRKLMTLTEDAAAGALRADAALQRSGQR